MPKSTVSQTDPKVIDDTSAEERASAPKRKTNTSATSAILQRLTKLDSRIAQLTENGADGVSLQISESLSSQTVAIEHVADVLSSLQCSLVSAVTDAIDHQLQRAAPPANHGAEETGLATEEAAEGEEETNSSPLAQSSWDEIRDAFLRSHGEGDYVVEGDELHSEVEGTVESQDVCSIVEESPLENEISEPEDEAPELVTIGDPYALDEEELRAAVIDQERTISILAKRLQKKSMAAQPLTSDQLSEIQESLPEELQSAVSKTLVALNNQMRYSELELSLERARVSRQASQLETTSERLHARARAMGLEIAEDGTLGPSSGTPRGSKGRNWLGAMGFGN